MRRHPVVIALVFAACHQRPVRVAYVPALKSVTLVEMQTDDRDGSAAVGGVARFSTGEPLRGVTVIVQGKEGERGDISADDGSYKVDDLAPGDHVIRVYYGNDRAQIVATIPKGATAHVDVVIDPSVPREVMDLTCGWSMIDQGSTNTGTNITAGQAQNIPHR